MNFLLDYRQYNANNFNSEFEIMGAFMDKKEAIDEYNNYVNKNLKQNFWNYASKETAYSDIKKKEMYKDPDEAYDVSLSVYENIIHIEGNKRSSTLHSFSLSSDGLCGIKKIIQCSASLKEAKENYRLIREGMFECLIWPSHAQNINICRGLKYPFDDRIDLTLIDIQSFYKKICENKELSLSLINDIKNDKENCLLARAYLNLMTFTWLCSFHDFNSFIEERKLGPFVNVSKGKFIAEQWTDSKEFDNNYFIELINRTKEYKVQNNIH